MKIINKNLTPWRKDGDHEVSRLFEGDPFYALERRMNDLFGDFLGNLEIEPSRSLASFAPRLEVTEDEKSVNVSAELPGLDEKDVEVSLEDDVLTIKGEKKEEHEEKKGGFYRSERTYGSFERCVVLPNGIDSDKAAAEFKKGVLKIQVPKKPEAVTNKKKIEVKGE